MYSERSPALAFAALSLEPRADTVVLMDVTKGEARRWSTETGHVLYEQRAPGVLVFRMSGRMDPSFVDHFEQAVAPFVALSKQVDLFFDTHAMTGYHPLFRERMTAWHAAFKPLTRSAHVLLSSKLVAMAIAIANLVTGGMLKTHSSEAEFEAMIKKAVQSANAA
jgi:hypothetical protein